MCSSCGALSAFLFFFFKQKTAYEMRISDWSSDVCSSDLSPVLVGDDWDRLRAYFGDAIADIDCTFPAGGDAAALRDAIARIRREAEDAVRAGRSELFLTDQHIGPGRVGVAMVLAAAAVHTHLVRKGLRTIGRAHV